ncbi:uncharacterized protein LOC120015952 [Tripterygium wilfordii]|uniref:uncharacterized protein LOC120015952 n=1 Tax=Tripterygium wilfordii TaxID=458696 RepID=UPI0018F85EF4|nr:uncharacterized protein LOC120015952 [Tripterygium wilfordii]
MGIIEYGALAKTKIKEDQWRVWCSHNDSSADHQRSLPSPVVSLIQDFYSAINYKDLQKLDQVLADDCVFIDLIFYNPFAGKQGIINFLSHVMEAMGPNIHLVMSHVKAQDNSCATVDWNLANHALEQAWHLERAWHPGVCSWSMHGTLERGMVFWERVLVRGVGVAP